MNILAAPDAQAGNLWFQRCKLGLAAGLASFLGRSGLYQPLLASDGQIRTEIVMDLFRRAKHVRKQLDVLRIALCPPDKFRRTNSLVLRIPA